MTLEEIATATGARLVTAPADPPTIDEVVAGDRISDLLEASTATSLVVTNLASRQLLELADLLDVPALCFLRGAEPDAAVVSAAVTRGTALLVSPAAMFETCGRLWQLLETTERVQ